MLRKSLNFLTLSLINKQKQLALTRFYAPRYRKEPGVEHRKKDFGEDFLENQEDPELIVS